MTTSVTQRAPPVTKPANQRDQREEWSSIKSRESRRPRNAPTSCGIQSIAMATTPTSHVVEVFFDGDCPLCTKEIALLRRLDHKSRIRFSDIAAPGFEACDTPWTQAELMDSIRGRLGDGTPIEGVEVFRRLYAAVGFGPLVALTRLPGVSHGLDAAYRLFAKNRLKLTGRCTPEGCAVRASPGASTQSRAV